MKKTGFRFPDRPVRPASFGGSQRPNMLAALQREPDRITHRFAAEPVEAAGSVRPGDKWLKNWCNKNLLNVHNKYIHHMLYKNTEKTKIGKI